MKKIISTIAAVLAVVTLKAQSEGAADLEVGDPVPQFTVMMTDGTTIDSKDFAGHNVLINFWATWCPPCRLELARVEAELIDRFADRDFIFLAISRGETLEKVMAFREQTGYTFPMGLDPDGEIFALFAGSGIPRNYFIDTDGNVLEFELGYTPEGFDALVEKISNHLQ
ncbi:MAG: TlpA family protein disulfide reductase [Rikenellaceae bacterium]|nr:TlpA family protein disulfide reductase [Rikenellaceae bacterium]